MDDSQGHPDRPPGAVPKHGRDLRVSPLPATVRRDWLEPESVVQALYDRAEAKALETIDWYLAARRPKKRASRALRAAAIVLGSAGALEPVVAAPLLGSVQAVWGYLLLGAAAACVAFDRFFGISSGWMRCMQSAQHLQGLLEDFQYNWLTANQANPSGPLTIADQITMLRTFAERVTQVVQGETGNWVQEFNSNLAQLERQTSQGTRADGGSAVQFLVLKNGQERGLHLDAGSS